MRRHTHHRSRLGYNPFSFFFVPDFFCHRSAANQAENFGAAKRADIANIEQLKKIVPLITREIPFGRVGVWSQCNGFGCCQLE